jgi:capsular exopolysaccharide synthesis family protein
VSIPQVLRRRLWLLPAFALPLAAAGWLFSPAGRAPVWTAEVRVAVNLPDPSAAGLARLPDPHAVWNAPATSARGGALLAEALKRSSEEAAAFARQLESAVRVEVREEGVRILASAPEEVVAGTYALVFARAAAEEARFRRDQALSAASAEAGRRAEEAQTRLDGAVVPASMEGREEEARRRLAALNAAAHEIERQVEAVRARQDRTLARIRTLEADEHRLRELLPSGPEEDGLLSPVLDRLRAEMASVRTDMALKGLDRAPESPAAAAAKSRLADLDQALRLELHRVRAQTIVALRESLGELEGELRTLDERRLRKSLEIRDLADDVKAGERKLGELDALRREAAERAEDRRRLAALLEAPGPPPLVPGRLAGDPQPSGGRSGSTTPAWIGLGLGLLLGLSAMVLAFVLDSRIRSGRDVRRHLDLPCLGVMERVGNPFLLRTSDAGIFESHGMAATMLRAYLQERGFKTVLVAGASEGEGKSTTAANLAVSLARKGLRVALVDADLRRPRLHELFGVDNSGGLTAILAGGPIDPCLEAGATELPTLRVLPSGPLENAAPEQVEGERLAELVRRLRDAHDVVILDGPPLTGASEALALAKVADTVLWAVRAGRQDLGRLRWAKQLLHNLHADVAGAVVTMAARSDVGAYAPAAAARA